MCVQCVSVVCIEDMCCAFCVYVCECCVFSVWLLGCICMCVCTGAGMCVVLEPRPVFLTHCFVPHLLSVVYSY